jgi:hypothetical protein
MDYKELLQLIRELFPKQNISIQEETYLRTKYPIIYIKSKTYSMEIKNQRIGTITIPDKWQVKLPEQTDRGGMLNSTYFISTNILKIPEKNIKEFIAIAGIKLVEYESLKIQLDIFYKSLDDLKTNPEEQIRDFKLNNLLLFGG